MERSVYRPGLRRQRELTGEQSPGHGCCQRIGRGVAEGWPGPVLVNGARPRRRGARRGSPAHWRRGLRQTYRTTGCWREFEAYIVVNTGPAERRRPSRRSAEKFSRSAGLSEDPSDRQKSARDVREGLGAGVKSILVPGLVAPRKNRLNSPARPEGYQRRWRLREDEGRDPNASVGLRAHALSRNRRGPGEAQASEDEGKEDHMTERLSNAGRTEEVPERRLLCTPRRFIPARP